MSFPSIQVDEINFDRSFASFISILKISPRYFKLTYLLPFPVFEGMLKRSPGPVALFGFQGQVKKPDCSGLDLCVVAISSLYALQAMRLVGGLTAQTVWG